jgi:hypothetical protein
VKSAELSNFAVLKMGFPIARTTLAEMIRLIRPRGIFLFIIVQHGLPERVLFAA